MIIKNQYKTMKISIKKILTKCALNNIIFKLVVSLLFLNKIVTNKNFQAFPNVGVLLWILVIKLKG